MDWISFWNLLREALSNNDLAAACGKTLTALAMGANGVASAAYEEIFDWAKPHIEGAKLRMDFEKICGTLDNMQGEQAAFALSFCKGIHALPNSDEIRIQMIAIIVALWKKNSLKTAEQLCLAQQEWVKRNMPSLLPGAEPRRLDERINYDDIR